MVKKIVENDHGSIWYGDNLESHVKNTIHDEIKDPLTEINALRERVTKIESNLKSQYDFEKKTRENNTIRIAIITAIITLLVGLPGIFSLIIQLISKH
ncbi:hypothetical protein [Lactococcus sp.]|uniref:hypothetical protein n=1 Tax=Lactococcus sp. TaxID=44273 RepID=UPI0035B34FBA